MCGREGRAVTGWGRIEGGGEDHRRDWMIRGRKSSGRENKGL
jgi:hypothetical protein